MAKDWAKKFYSSTLWENARGYALKRDRYVCRRCGAPATMVHHRVYLTEDNIKDFNFTINPANLESLCDECHKREHDEQRTKKNLSDEKKKIRELIQPDYVFDANGNIIPSNRGHVPPPGEVRI